MYSIVALNAVWVLLALSSVLWFALAERRNLCVQARGRQWQRTCAVLLAVCLLFPCVSASDDILALSGLRFGSGGSSPSTPSKTSAHLERVLQGLEHIQLSSVFVLPFALCCIGHTYTSGVQSMGRQLPCIAGRGPPVSA